MSAVSQSSSLTSTVKSDLGIQNTLEEIEERDLIKASIDNFAGKLFSKMSSVNFWYPSKKIAKGSHIRSSAAKISELAAKIERETPTEKGEFYLEYLSQKVLKTYLASFNSLCKKKLSFSSLPKLNQAQIQKLFSKGTRSVRTMAERGLEQSSPEDILMRKLKLFNKRADLKTSSSEEYAQPLRAAEAFMDRQLGSRLNNLQRLTRAVFPIYFLPVDGGKELVFKHINKAKLLKQAFVQDLSEALGLDDVLFFTQTGRVRNITSTSGKNLKSAKGAFCELIEKVNPLKSSLQIDTLSFWKMLILLLSIDYVDPSIDNILFEKAVNEEGKEVLKAKVIDTDTTVFQWNKTFFGKIHYFLHERRLPSRPRFPFSLDIAKQALPRKTHKDLCQLVKAWDLDRIRSFAIEEKSATHGMNRESISDFINTLSVVKTMILQSYRTKEPLNAYDLFIHTWRGAMGDKRQFNPGYNYHSQNCLRKELHRHVLKKQREAK
ncbi:MAG: hypothetical protein L7U87_01850 [Chlamydiales bacterium]|nr:hypothetical protein [Chlamydiales bacterium]